MATAKTGITLAADGEKEFRQAISSINSDMKVLGSEMKKVTAEFLDNKNSVEALTAKDEVLNKQYDTQKQKVEALRQALENAKTQYDGNTTKINSWKTSLNNAEADLSKLDNEIKNNRSAMEQAKNPTSEMADNIKKVGSNADDSAPRVLKMGDIIKANLISGAIISGVKSLANSFKGLVNNALESADGIQQMADVTGMSAESIQEWQFAGDTLGVSVDTITGAQAKLTKSMNASKDGTGTQAEAFKQLGVSILDANGNLKDAKGVMLEAFNALGNVGNETERDALSMSIFGKSAMDLNPLIKAGADELSNLTDQARDSGAVMSNETVSSLDDFGDSIGQVKQSLTAMAGSILKELMPTLQPLIQTVKDNAPQIAQVVGNVVNKAIEIITFLVQNGPVVIPIISGIGAALIAWNVASMINGVVKSIQAFKKANEGATIAQWALNAAQNANPIGIIVALIVGLIAAVIVLWNTNEGFRNAVKEIFSDIGNFIGGVVNVIGDFFTKTIPDAANVAGQGISDGFNSAVNFLESLPGRIFGFLGNLGSDAFNWGKDMLDGFINGIKSMMGNIGNAAKGIADKIRSFLHFSVPDEGPLTDYESWMPDFMGGLAQGINKNQFRVTDAVKNLSSNIKSNIGNLNADVNISSNGNKNSLYGTNLSPQDILSLANRPIILQINGREFAYATKDDFNSVLAGMVGV